MDGVMSEKEAHSYIYSALQHMGGKGLMDRWVDVDKRAERMDGCCLKTEERRG